MLAPRNKLWSTPIDVIDRAISLLDIQPTDVIFDIGAGDGRFLTRCAELTGVYCTGVEINEIRVQEALEKILAAQLTERCAMICGNALEQDYSQGTVFYLYLVPRGLRLILPILKSIRHPIKVVTYMAPFPDSEKPLNIVKCTSASHPDAMWPLYLYQLNAEIDPQQQNNINEELIN